MTPNLPTTIPTSTAGTILRTLAWILLASAALACLIAFDSAHSLMQSGAGDFSIGAAFIHFARWSIPAVLGAMLLFACASWADAAHSAARQAVLQSQLLSQIAERVRPAPATFARHGIPTAPGD